MLDHQTVYIVINKMELFWPLQDGSREEKYFKPLSFCERKELTWLQHMQVNITLKYELATSRSILQVVYT